MILRVYVNLPEGNGNGDFKIFSHGPVEIVDLPIKHGGSFHSFLYVSRETGHFSIQHGDFPEANWAFKLGYPPEPNPHGSLVGGFNNLPS